jgi:hypothetical protein
MKKGLVFGLVVASLMLAGALIFCPRNNNSKDSVGDVHIVRQDGSSEVVSAPKYVYRELKTGMVRIPVILLPIAGQEAVIRKPDGSLDLYLVGAESQP